MTDEMLTVRELAEFLRINEKKIYQLANEGKLPGTRAAGKWIFPRSLVTEWIQNKARRSLEGDRPVLSPDFQVTLMVSDDIAVDALVRHFNRTQDRFVAVTAVVGSSRALDGIVSGRADIGGMHLMDPDGRTYNRAYVARALSGRRGFAIHAARRTQGLMTAPGNPLDIRGLSDLARPDVRFVNRQAGSGTRKLLDRKLAELDIPSGSINGYDREVDSHIEAGMAVLGSEADAALGIGPAAGALGLEFLPLHEEVYELVVLESRFYRPVVQAFFETVKSDYFRKFLDALPGYGARDTGQLSVVEPSPADGQ